MAEKSIELDSVEIAAAVFGNCDRNIRMLEKEFSVTAVCRGTMLRISGEPANVAAAARAVEGMLLLIENHTPLEDQTVRYCLSLAHDGEEKRVRELTEDFVTVTVKGRPIRPKTLGQKEYLNAIRNNAITFGVGPAGTGKTYLAVAMAVKAFKAKDVSRIVLTRPAVEAGEKLGFLPGDLQQKVDPYLRPLYDGLFDMLGAETYERLVEKQIIEVAPLAYMRGRTLDDSFIILDEAQNTTGTDEDVPDPYGRRLQGRRHRRCHPDRPARPHPQRPCGRIAGAQGCERHRTMLLYRKRRGASPSGAGDHQGLRGSSAPFQTLSQ